MKLYDVFGLFSLTLPYKAVARQEMPKLLVLPRLSRLGSIPLPAMESPVNAAGAARATEDPSAMADVRPYVPGDPVKRIHWKLSARQRQLLVKRYEPAAVSDALIYLDACQTDLDLKESWIAADVLCSVALSLAARVLEQGIPVELIHRDDRRRSDHLAALEELPRLRRALARLELDGNCPLGELLSGESRALLGARFAWVLTRRLDASSVELADRYARFGVRLIWILCRGVHVEENESDSLIEELKKRQITVITVCPGDDLEQVMAVLA